MFNFLYRDKDLSRKYDRLKNLENYLGFKTPTKIDFIGESLENKLKEITIKKIEEKFQSKVGKMYLKREFKKFINLKFDYHLEGLENLSPLNLFKNL